MKRIFTLVLCALMLFTTFFSVSAQENANGANPKTEAQILDEMAQSWIWTCKENIKRCDDGLIVFSLGKIFEVIGYNESVIKEVYQPLKDGLVDAVTGSGNTSFVVNVDGLEKELLANDGENGLKYALERYTATEGAEALTPEWEEHLQAGNTVRDIVKNGELAKDVDIWEVVKENYAFLLGRESCEDALVYFQMAQETDDLEKKREYMLIGASLATFGCEMSIENADEITKAPYTDNEIKFDKKAQEELMISIVENAVDVVGEVVPEIKIAMNVISITTDIGIKMLSMQNKLNALSGYITNPDTIEEDKSGFYDALSNQYDRFTYEISDFEIILDEYNGYLRVSDEYKKVVIEEDLFGFPVVEFGGTFADKLVITEITIPSTIVSRSPSSVVNDCDKLEKVYYNAVNCKGWDAGYFFNKCDSDFKVIFGEGVQVIPEQFIGNCGLSAIAFPEGITTIHGGALVNCNNLKTVTIPSTLETFDIFGLTVKAVVDNCANLEKVYYNAVSPDGRYYNAVFSECGNSAEEMVVIFGENVTVTPLKFLDRCGVKSVVFPEGVTQIQESAIYGCEKLESITIPSTVKKFGHTFAYEYIFANCNNLKAVYYNAPSAEGETSIRIFRDIQNDFTIYFGQGIEGIPEHFIENCGLTAITFPEGVKTIDNDCLVNCNSLKTITVPFTAESIEYNFAKNCGNLETIYFNANCTSTRNTAMISDCGNFEAPGMKVLLGPDVTTVPNHFIENCSITDFVYPEGVLIINDRSLVNCSALETVVIPSTVEQIGYQMVSRCSNLKTIEYNARNAVMISDSGYAFSNSGHADGLEIGFADDVETLPIRFMNNCSVHSVAFSGGLTKIPEQAIRDCTELTTLTIPENVTAIGSGAFYGSTGLTDIYFNAVNAEDLKDMQNAFAYAGENGNGINVVIGTKVTRIPGRLFRPTNTTTGSPKIVSVEFEEGSICASIGEFAFGQCASLPAINIPGTITTIGENAFTGCTGLTSVTMNNGVREIEPYAFSQCTSLPSIAIPKSVTDIGNDAFNGCSGLTEVYYNAANATDLTAVRGAFADAGENGLQVIIGKDATKIPARLFSVSGNSTITSVKFEEGSMCASIGAFAFAKCTTLPTIDIPGSVTTIGKSAFTGCTGLTDVILKNGLQAIGDSAFSKCPGLSSIRIPDSVTTIGEEIFSDCTGLSNVTIGKNVTGISRYAFRRCTGLTNIAIPDGITGIEYYAFAGCTGLTTISIQDSVTDIASNVFADCSELKTVIYCGTEDQWNAIKITNYGNSNLLNANRQYHDWVEDPDTMLRTCRICGMSECVELGHDWNAATCTSAKTCKTCGKTEGAELGHDWNAATCTNAKTCKTCGKTEGTELGHDWNAATCTSAKTCKTCGKTEGTELGHDWNAATCTNAKTCKTCGKTEGTELGHDWVDADCTTPKTCSVCKITEGKPAGHIYGSGVDGTCNACGIHRETTEDRTVMHMFRMYDPNSGEHFYTGSEEERDNLVAEGWNYEGVGFTFSRTTGMPVYRLYDPITGEHLYTMQEPVKTGTQYEGKDLYECEGRIWLYEGIAFNSAYDTEVPQYRLRNPNATRGAYHFTSSTEERDNLIAAGWISEGICFYSSWK